MNPLLLKPTELIPTYDNGSLAALTNGGTSFLTSDPPATNACDPILQNWWTATNPERIT